MRFYRIATTRWALDRLCAGARMYGGRWNPIGIAALYGGASIESAALEKLVHLAGAIHPPFKLVAIDVPEEPSLYYEPPIAQFPQDWAEMPTSAGAQAFGEAWLREAKYLAMKVPSAIVPESRNVVVNPAHPGFADVKLEILREFSFDSRLFKSK